jgi:hypothetical protein
VEVRLLDRRSSWATLALLLAIVVLGGAGRSQTQAPSPVRFRNIASVSGIAFVLENDATPQKHVIETMPGGVAAFDYNGDGRTDLFFANGAEVPSLKKNGRKYWNRLFENLDGMKFRDVTESAGLQGAGYSVGASAADYDNDADIDLFVAGVRGNHLYRNNGDGRFSDVTDKAGLASSSGWAITGGWFDYDNDGLLDLLIVNYLKWDPASEPACGDPPRVRAYCHPRMFEGLPNALYRNRGDGTFENVTARSGIGAHVGKGMSVAFADYDNDGWADAFVTNDKIPSFLFHNRRDGTFEEVGLAAGVALPDHGRGVSAMGADFRDYDNDGLPDVTFAALAGETFPLFRNQGSGWFTDVTYRSRLGPLAIARSGWSPGLFDFNNDGFKDLFVTGAHVNNTVEIFENTRYRLPNSIFVNAGDGTFRDGSAEAGADFQAAAAHRGSAFADFDNDGRIDVAVSVIGGPAELWHNESPGKNWLIVKPVGTKANFNGIGARVRVGSQWNEMASSMGYASSGNFGVHFGLGAINEVEVEVRWPGGGRRLLHGVKAGQVLRVEEPK